MLFAGVQRMVVMLAGLVTLTAACAPRLPRATAPDVGSEPTLRERRVARAATTLAVATPAAGTIRVGAIRRGGVGAWAWRDGRIEVTPALVDLLDDEELTAAIAHELGHLVAGGHVGQAPAAIVGKTDGVDAEHIADILGCRLLLASGTSPAAMTRMLERMAATLGADGGFRERAAAVRAGACAGDARRTSDL